MPGWKLVDTDPTDGRIFKRPLGLDELWLLWSARFEGTTDALEHCEIRLLNGSQDAHLFSDASIVKAWLSTKRRYPLAGATVQGANNAPLQLDVTADPRAGNGTGFISEPNFVVREQDLAIIRPHEIVFGSVACAEEIQQRMTEIIDGPRPISDELLNQLYVFRETDPKREDILHLMILSAHLVVDRMAKNTLVRCLLDTLARGEGLEPPQIPLEERLAMEIPSMDLEPEHLRLLSPAIRRWQRAAGIVIFQLRMAKIQGGHTLPCRVTSSTQFVPARSSTVSASLTHAQTTTVIANCRRHGVKFGDAYLALSQVAMTRVLYRRYLRGEISEEEWAYRKRQPHNSAGPFSLRPYLDKTWFEKGGAGELIFSAGIFFYQLPFMTMGKTTEQHPRVLSDGAPPFSDLLTFDRFLHRAGLIKKQVTAFFSHPLFFDIVRANTLARLEFSRLVALQWMEHAGTADSQDTHGNPDDEVQGPMDMPIAWGFGGSSAGRMDLVSPIEYPLPPTHPLSPYSSVPHPVKAGYATPPEPSTAAIEAKTTPKIAANCRIHMQAHPAQLYITADSLNGQVNLRVIYDKNVFEDDVVTEWVNEVREALLWYLGRTHVSRRGAGTRVEGVQAKL